jgi:hypothetical protein
VGKRFGKQGEEGRFLILIDHMQIILYKENGIDHYRIIDGASMSLLEEAV